MLCGEIPSQIVYASFDKNFVFGIIENNMAAMRNFISFHF